MLRVTTKRFAPINNETFYRMMEHIKKRDPNDRYLRTGQILFEVVKRMHAYFIAMAFVVGGVSYRQFQDYTIVKAPVHDGRSLVI
jgi:hypothetical protein